LETFALGNSDFDANRILGHYIIIARFKTCEIIVKMHSNNRSIDMYYFFLEAKTEVSELGMVTVRSRLSGDFPTAHKSGLRTPSGVSNPG